MKNKSNILAASFLSIMMLTGCGFNANKDAVIKINDNVITKQQYQQEYDKIASNPMFKQLAGDLKSNPDGYVGLMMKDRIVNELIVKQLLDEGFKKHNVQVSDSDVEKELKTIIEKVGTKEKLNEFLKQNGISSTQFKNDLKEELKIKKLVEQLSLVNITEEMMKNFYNSNLSKFQYPDKVRASHILISADEKRIKEIVKAKEEFKNATEEEINQEVQKMIQSRLAKAEKILAEAKNNPNNFANLAKENSDDPGSAQQGGDLGFFTKEQMVPEFSKAAFSAKPSVVTGLVKTSFGYHIILVKDRIAAGTEPYEKVKDEIKMYLENQEKIKVLQDYLANAKKSANIQYVDASFNPDEIQKKIKEQAKERPSLQTIQMNQGQEANNK